MSEENEVITQSVEEKADVLKHEEKRKLDDAHNAVAIMNDFFNKVYSGVYRGSFISTGFKNLDSILDGGLYPGLYILGAISSLGKTSMMLQMADQISAAGHDVAYFSLEMSETELIAKSLSRLTYLKCDGNTANAKTIRGILAAERYKSYSKEEQTLIDNASLEYSLHSDNIYIYEGVGDIGAEAIRNQVKKQIEIRNKKPVLMIDYIQILSPYDPRYSDKQNTDKSILELKRISRDLNIPVIAISSFNRNSYNSEVDMSAFRESSSIEYGSDVLMALQPKGIVSGYNKKDIQENARIIKECKRSTTRQIELVILKNRNGKTGVKVDFEYKALFNYFKEKGIGAEEEVKQDVFSGIKNKFESAKNKQDDFEQMGYDEDLPFDDEDLSDYLPFDS